MLDRRTKPISWTSLALTVVFGLLAPACQNAMSIEEAKKVTADFSGTSFVPPPRTINDIEAMLEQQARTQPEMALRDRADAQPPDTTDRAALAEFYFNRGLAAREIGVSKQEIDDLTKALEYWEPGGTLKNYEILYRLSMAQLSGGSYSRHLEYRKRAIQECPNSDVAWLLSRYSIWTLRYADLGDLKAAEAALAEVSTLYYQSFRLGSEPHYEANFAQAQAAVLDAKGKYAEAEALYRQAISALSGPVYARWTFPEGLRDRLAQNLINQGRLLEAETEARAALRGMLAKRGRYSPQTASILHLLVWVLLDQGRYQEAERMARASIATYEKVGTPPGSLHLAFRRRQLASALVGQGRDQEALAEYETIRAGLSGQPGALEKLVNRNFLNRNFLFAEVLLRTGQADRALEPLGVALERSMQMGGEANANTARIRSLMARVYAAKGDTPRALHEFREATALLLARAPDVDDEATSPREAELRFIGTL